VSIAWPAFDEALAEGLAALTEDQFLVMSVKRCRSSSADGVDGAARFVQFVAQGAYGLRAEAASNNYLVGADRLGPEQEDALVAIGWQPPTSDADTAPIDDPDGSPNHFRDWPAPALRGGRTAGIRDVPLRYRVPHPGYLGTQRSTPMAAFDLPILGLKRGEVPVPVVDESVVQLTLSRPQNADALRAEVMGCLGGILDTDEITVDADGDVPIRWGSAVVYVRVLEHAPVVRMVSVVLTGAAPSGALREAVNDINRDQILVRALWHDDAVLLTADMYASPFVDEHLVNVLRIVADMADALDDEMHNRFSDPAGDQRRHGFGGYL
jgi:hypothetical protein